MKTPCELPGLSCFQGKPITTISTAWLPVNNMTHKLIMAPSLLPLFSSLLPLTLSHSITPMAATPPVWCPAHIPSAAHSFQSRSHLNDSGGGQMRQMLLFFWSGGLSWRTLGEVRENYTHRCSALTSEKLQLNTFLEQAASAMPGALVKSLWHPLCC